MASLGFLRRGFALGLAVFVWAGPVSARPEIDTTGMAPIDVDVQSATVSSVLRMFHEFSGRNIISGPEVTGTSTAKLDGVPWLVALDTVLRANGYGWEEDAQGIIRVTTMEKLQTERLNEAVAERKQEEFLPLETSVVPVSYAKADEMKKPLSPALRSRQDGPTSARMR
jgi:type IV pilus assembly protein PilQ